MNTGISAWAHSVQRRRKQLRVAQQTYRRRKEAMITSLHIRVQELESSIEELSESFLTFSNLLLGADILEKHPRVTAALQKITQQYVLLAKSGCDDRDQAGAANCANPQPKKPRIAQNINLDHNLDIAQHCKLPIIENMTQSSLATRGQSQVPLTPLYQEQPILQSEIDLPSTTDPSSTTSPPLQNTPNITPQGSLMKQDWTFSRILVRKCYENGYRLLVDSTDDLTTIQRVFGRQLTTLERKDLISTFYAAMHDEVGDLIKFDADFLSHSRPKNNAYPPEQSIVSSTKIQNGVKVASDMWLDASGVYRLLLRKGIIAEANGSERSGLPFDFPANFNVLAFIRRKSFN
ncbi:hypothetical protein F1880_007473 [Penicillium rolfsii]|nr:hypothetical protein F1880_007473 [Penicillium rolfsii]